jgi:NADH:ubiquinone oxidoreductase subunit 5 (subunit L)/multisubunit Na+/H+ antiporter MnhA subunit
MIDLLWLIPVLPFLGALLNGVVLRRRIGRKAVAWIACGIVGATALLSLLVISDYLTGYLADYLRRTGGTGASPLVYLPFYEQSL